MGASIRITPLSARTLPISFVADGEIVLISMQIRPDLADSITPFLPSSTCLTSGVSGTHVIIASLLLATSAGLSAQLAPSKRSCSAFAFVRLWTVSGYPAFSRLWAIGLPIMPVPIKPMLSLAIFLYYLESAEDGLCPAAAAQL